MVAPFDLLVGTIQRCPITRAIDIKTEITVIEGCSLSPRSHPLVDSASGQSWPATTPPLSGICSLGARHALFAVHRDVCFVAAPPVSVIVRIILWPLDFSLGGTGR
jgi:hypothetical protein